MGDLCAACSSLLVMLAVLAIIGPLAFWLGYRRGYKPEGRDDV